MHKKQHYPNNRLFGSYSISSQRILNAFDINDWHIDSFDLNDESFFSSNAPSQ